MSRLRLTISMSLDGYVAGPHQSVKEPLGIGGEALHEWVFPLAAWREPHGMKGGEVNESTPMVEHTLTNIGATIMGRNMFGGGPGPWNTEQPWIGWWKDNPPFHHPVFVLTHYPREPLPLKGGTTFHFVTGGMHEALERARKAAGGKDCSAGRGRAGLQPVPEGRAGGRDADQRVADTPGRRRTAVRRRGRRSPRPPPGTDGGDGEGDASAVCEAVRR